MRPSWIGLYTTQADWLAGSEPIRWLVTPQGLYEGRPTPIGTFWVARPDVPLDTVSEGFVPAIPRMPQALLTALLTHFRAALPHEALANVYWDRPSERFLLEFPAQTATATSVVTTESSDPYDPDRPRVLQVHSHGTLPAFFSETDDADEQATGCYGVIGRLDTATPQTCWRASCGGRFIPLDSHTLFAEDQEGSAHGF